MATSRSGRVIKKPSKYNNFGFDTSDEDEEVTEPRKKVRLKVINRKC